jgi:hypothetical protein
VHAPLCPYDGHKGWFGEHPNGFINLPLPTSGAQSADMNYFASRSHAVTGMLIHELTHVLQRAESPTTYDADRRRLAQLQLSDGSSPEEFAGYYSLLSEQEAHGAQAAVEITLSGCSFEQTFMWTHI